MDHVVAGLRYAASAAFLWLALRAFLAWRRSSDRIQTWLAAVLASLGVVSTFTVLDQVASYRVEAFTSIRVAAFMWCGYFILLLRDVFVPVPHVAKRVALAGTVVATIFATIAPPPVRADEGLVVVRFSFGGIVIMLWFAMVVEPVVRFWLISRSRRGVQRARLRLLALGFAGLVVLIAAHVVTGRMLHRPSGYAVAVQAFGLLLAPILTMSVDPPRWVRRAWRVRSGLQMRRAMHDLITYASDAQTLAARAVDAVSALVGARAAWITSARGEVLASAGEVRRDEIARAEPRRDGAPHIDRLEDAYLIVVPFSDGDETASLAVVSDAFTPVFGTDEVEMLADYATMMSAAFQRVRLVRALDRERAMVDVTHRTLAQLGEAIVVAVDHELVYANEAVAQITGYSLEELRTVPALLGIVAGEDRDRVAARLRMPLPPDGTQERYEANVIRKNGSRVTLEVTAKPVMLDGRRHIVAIARDITERKRDEEEASESRRQLEEAQAIARLGSWTWRVGAGEVAWSSEMYRIHDIAPGQLITRDRMWDAVHAEDRDWVYAFFLSLVEGGEPIELEYRIERPDGEIRTILSRARMSRDRAGHRVMIGAAQDVTEIRRAEEILREGQRKYAEAYERERAAVERLKALDEMKNAFLTAVSHELRTPLTSVVGFAQTLEQHGEVIGAEQRALFTSRLTANARKLDRLLNDILDLDRLHRGIIEPRRRPVGIGSLVRRVVEELELAGEPWLHLDLEEIVADVDGAKVERIVENLLRNVRRHTPPGTNAWVRVRSEAGGVAIVVEDDGPGVPAEIIDAVFDPFRRGETDPHAPGVGIGLSLVARLAELHEGSATAAVRAGGGATFRVFLKAAVSTERVMLTPSPEPPERTCVPAERAPLRAPWEAPVV